MTQQLVSEELVKITESDYDAMPDQVSVVLASGASAHIKQISSNLFYCDVLDLKSGLTVHSEGTTWAHALIVSVKGFYEHLKENEAQ